MARSEYICVFDCETVPDSDTLRRVFGYEGSDIEVAKEAFKTQLEKSGSEFLPVCFHEVVAISAVMADKFGRFLRVSTMQGKNEEEKITKFINFINEHNPRLVSFNGRGFDLPMLMVRAMRYNLQAEPYFSTSDKENGKDKWTNYRSRYDGIFHLDLLDHISDFRAVSGLKLDTLCASLNLPGKYDVHGDQVIDMFYEEKLDKINEYCESDTLNTYWLFLKYELLRGKLTKDDYANYLSQMSDYLKEKKTDMSYTPVFSKFIDDELDRLKDSL
ncbi:3'-5' exonuclease [Campylobacter fetus]|uniref:3'-5' exonuclease n=1 Tax=Campylobacter fetus TaxID=196 RepID=A0A5N7FX08_CAMFE|nr:3'-5' exonuclease [Campylobacter fetus]EAI4415090.1 3'-5' exonuclease [Campylobacter fetus]EAI5407612.1 3'-5' exonuclease [Campylobacter fetus]EAJ0327302.1 3'-5' exonuclease [Campylobacter fetus]EAJ1230618.1 3'-5' exonuclease [Campylobacter fetus]EAK0416076.1 3'-5' exonuclease [Campylobacter fetus]